MTDWSRACIILMKASAHACRKRTVCAYKANQADRKASCFQSYSPQSRHECVDCENLVQICIMRSSSQEHM